MNVIKPGAVVAETASLGSNIEVGYNAVILSRPDRVTSIADGVSIGANATIYEGLSIGMHALILPGSVVRQSVPPLAIVEGNPASIVGYRNTSIHEAKPANDGHVTKAGHSRVKGVKVIEFANIPDMRGSLTVGEFDKQIPFLPHRYFLVYGVPTAETRGEHAHFKCHQFLIAVSGSVNVIADDGIAREEFTLDKNNVGLYLPPMTWGIQYRYSKDAVLLVFASDYYEPEDYIRDYGEFVDMTARRASEQDRAI